MDGVHANQRPLVLTARHIAADCPLRRVPLSWQPWRDPETDRVLPAYDASFDEAGVSAVFKRLFEPYCELQLLFEEKLGASLLATYHKHRPTSALVGKRGATGSDAARQADGMAREEIDAALMRALPLSLLWRVTDRLMARPFPDERALLAALRRPAGSALPDATLFRISINLADAPGRVMVPAAGAQRSGSGGPSAALALLRGDALVSPHYRLGIGVNHAFETLPHLSELLRDAWANGGRAAFQSGERAPKRRGGDASSAAVVANRAAAELLGGDAKEGGDADDAGGATWHLLDRWVQTSGAAASALAQYQLSVMYLEAHCALLVLGERVYRRVALPPRSLEEVTLGELDELDENGDARYDCSPSAAAEARAAEAR